ncbi:hypothetical protein ACFLUP_02200 [Chloroflexota bacterium]
MSDLHNSIIKRSGYGTRLTKGHGLKDVVVFGAGVSVSQGIPVATNLLREMLNFGGPRSLDIVTEFIEYAYPTFKTKGSRYPLAEDVLGMLDIAESYSTIRGRSRGYRWRAGAIQQVRDRFLRSLGAYLWSFQDKEMDADHPLRRFVGLFNKHTVYITFNYDLTLETALSLEKIPYNYGIPIPANGVAIIKPHGSINWFHKTKDFPRRESDKWFELGPTMVCFTQLHPARGWSDRPPAIIPPAPSKKIEEHEFKTMWTSFSSVVHSTNKTAIVGYSLPEADRLSRLILRRPVLASRPPDILVVNPTANVKNVYEENLSDKIRFLTSKFEDWVQMLEDSV